MYNIRISAIRLLISIAIKVVLEHFSLDFRLFKILNISFPEMLWPWKCRSRSRCTTFAIAFFYGSWDSCQLYKRRTWAFFASSHRVPDIEYYDCQKFFDLEDIGQGHDVQHSQWHHSMANINFFKKLYLSVFTNSHRFPDMISKIFQNFSYMGTYIYANWSHTHTHTRARARAQREIAVMTIDKICKADLS